MKTYQECLDWLYSQLPMFQKEGKSAYHPGLDNIKLLLKELGHPERLFDTIHVAGTNGKGSVSHMLASVCQEAGMKVGLYTSPHLKYFEERVRINGVPVSKQKVIEFTEKMQVSKVKPSFFEMTVGLAFETFAKENVDIAIIETGMGGRLDSTNVIRPLLSVITNIGMDHQQYLGNTIKEIAAEKAGIIKDQTPVIIGKKHPDTDSVFIHKAAESQAKIIWAENTTCPYETDLKGNYQSENLKTAFATLQELQKQKPNILQKHMEKGLLKVQKNTGLRGRYQQLGASPKIIADTGHNIDAMKWLMAQLQEEDFNQLHMVFGMANDKDSSTILTILPKSAQYYFCKPDVPRGKSEKELLKEARKHGLTGQCYNSVSDAFKAAKFEANKNDFIFIGGSTFVVAELEL